MERTTKRYVEVYIKDGGECGFHNVIHLDLDDSSLAIETDKMTAVFLRPYVTLYKIWPEKEETNE